MDPAASDPMSFTQRIGSCCLFLAAVMAGCEDAPTGDLGSASRRDAGLPLDLGSVPAPVDVGVPAVPSPPSICAERAETGPCLALFPRFTYDPALGRCVGFTWGGCGSNPNNFESLSECQQTCEPERTSCGGFAGLACEDNSYCDYEADQCGGADGVGLCRPRPTACDDVLDPVCGCDGRSYGNACLAAQAGFDVIGGDVLCAGVATCTDFSRDAIVELASYFTGRCRGECIFELRMEAQPVDCDRSVLVVRDLTRGPPLRVNTGHLSPEGHDAVRNAARALEGVPLEAQYGCPGCDDGPLARARIIRGGTGFDVTYEPGGPPEVLEETHQLVTEITEALSACVPNRYVVPDLDCTPPAE